MDFYSNDFYAQAESQRRQADLHRDAGRSFATVPAKHRDSKQWTREFAAWIVSRARIGDTFMAGTPMNP